MSNLTNCSYALFDSIANDTEVNDLILVQEAVAIIVPIIFGIIVIIGFVGNSLVILVVSAEPQMRSTTNLLIINLAVADWLFVIFCIPFTATDYSLPEWPFGNVWCKCVQYLIIVTACASVYTLVLMSFDRWVLWCFYILAKIFKKFLKIPILRKQRRWLESVFSSFSCELEKAQNRIRVFFRSINIAG